MTAAAATAAAVTAAAATVAVFAAVAATAAAIAAAAKRAAATAARALLRLLRPPAAAAASAFEPLLQRCSRHRWIVSPPLSPLPHCWPPRRPAAHSALVHLQQQPATQRVTADAQQPLHRAAAGAALADAEARAPAARWETADEAAASDPHPPPPPAAGLAPAGCSTAAHRIIRRIRLSLCTGGTHIRNCVTGIASISGGTTGSRNATRITSTTRLSYHGNATS